MRIQALLVLGASAGAMARQFVLDSTGPMLTQTSFGGPSVTTTSFGNPMVFTTGQPGVVQPVSTVNVGNGASGSNSFSFEASTGNGGKFEFSQTTGAASSTKKDDKKEEAAEESVEEEAPLKPVEIQPVVINPVEVKPIKKVDNGCPDDLYNIGSFCFQVCPEGYVKNDEFWSCVEIECKTCKHDDDKKPDGHEDNNEAEGHEEANEDNNKPDNHEDDVKPDDHEEEANEESGEMNVYPEKHGVKLVRTNVPLSADDDGFGGVLADSRDDSDVDIINTNRGVGVNLRRM